MISSIFKNLTKTRFKSDTVPTLAKISGGFSLPSYPRGHKHASPRLRVFLRPSHVCYDGAFGGVRAPAVTWSGKTNSGRPITLMVSLVCVVENLPSKETSMSNPTPRIVLEAYAHLSKTGQCVCQNISTLPRYGQCPRIVLDPKELSEIAHIPIDDVVSGINELEREGYLARLFRGKKEKKVYLLAVPDFNSTIQEVWG